MEAFRGEEQKIRSSLLRRELIDMLRPYLSRTADNPLKGAIPEEKLQELLLEFHTTLYMICAQLSRGTRIRDAYQDFFCFMLNLRKKVEDEKEILAAIDSHIEKNRARMDGAAFQIRALIRKPLQETAGLDEDQKRWANAIVELKKAMAVEKITVD